MNQPAAFTNWLRRDAGPEWTRGLEDLCRLLLPADALVAEIGVYAGESTAIFMASGRVRMLIAVDPWLDGYDPGAGATMLVPMADARAEFDRSVRDRYPHAIAVMPCRSLEAASLFSDWAFDLVYVDGHHGREHAAADFRAWMPKVKPGGYIAGHDYRYIDSVTAAVHEVIGEPQYTFEDFSFAHRVGT